MNSSNSSTTEIISNATGITEEFELKNSEMFLVKNVKFILCSTCILAVLTNLKVFACIYWIRRPFPSILKISLSLALADSFASCTSGILIFFEENLTLRFLVISEMIRLCFILVTVFHLLGLALNHYLGIHKPFKHNSKLSQKGVFGIIFSLWSIPTIFILTLYTLIGGIAFWKSLFHNELIMRAILFIHTFKFRMMFSSFVVISLICIVICYVLILLMIEKQRKIWNRFSFGGNCGGSIWKGKKMGVVDRHTNHVQNRLKSNSKAVHTTLIIMGSCLIGWIPALTIYTIACSTDCLISGDLLNYFNENYRREIIMLRFFDNEMLFLKMVANPIIYSIRMKEIQDGTKRMHDTILHYLGRKRRRKPIARSFYYSRTSNMRIASMKSFKRNQDLITSANIHASKDTVV